MFFSHKSPLFFSCFPLREIQIYQNKMWSGSGQFYEFPD